MIYVLGGSGALGKAIIRQNGAKALKIIDRNEYLKWISPIQAKKYFIENSIDSNDIIFICIGVTNPNSRLDELDKINFQIPKNILNTAHSVGCQIFSFGSIHENSKIINPYLQSKNKLLNFISSETNMSNHRHLQLHTIYGINAPKKHMLLGQIKDAIESKSELKMTSGEQFREYWHAADIATLVLSKNLVSTFGRVEQISSGRSFQIKKLAVQIFEHFDLLEKLDIGGIEDSLHENYTSLMLPRIPRITDYQREQFTGVIEYLEECLSGSID